MPTIKLRFPGGRYHATPWGHHVNEGLIEWPPSPWRLLRAFVACGFSSQGWMEVPPVARRLFDKLAAVLPQYRLPAASAAHSRHFMPIGRLEKGREKTTLVFDTWANVGDGELLIHWPFELEVEESELLGKLASSLGYLGRSESWVEAQLSDEVASEWNAVPCVETERRGTGWEQISLVAAVSPTDYALWREEAIAPILGSIQKAAPTKKVTSKQQAKYDTERNRAVAPYPTDLLACLTKDTSWWKGHGWSLPPGSQRVLYWRPSDALQVGVPKAGTSRASKAVTTILLALSAPSGRHSALPSVNRTLPQAELFHRAIVGRVAKGGQIDCPELTGKDQHGKPLQDYHRHAHTLPVDLNGDGRIDHIILYAEMGFQGPAQRAIRAMKRTWTKGGVGDLQLVLAGSGALEMLRQLPSPYDQHIEKLLGPPGGSRVWESITPFVFPRYLKPRGKNSNLGQVNAELTSRRRSEAVDVQIDAKLTQRLRHFVRNRSRGGVAPPVDQGFGMRIYFEKPVPGPLLLGYASHYGLGMFVAADEKPDSRED